MEFGAYLIEPPNRPDPGRAVEQYEGPRASIVSPGYLRELARHAEMLGFDSIWFPDHVVMPAKYGSNYPYQQREKGEYKRYPFDEVAFPEPFTALAYVAGATERIRLSTGVLILTERNPVLFAKQLATLDALSGGRVELGVGIGWLREESEALGIPWKNRGKRMDEYMQAMRVLWRDPIASYHGEFVNFTDIRCDPKPARAGGIPLIIGGHTEAAARRAGRLGDGYMPTSFQQRSDGWEFLPALREEAEKAGRNPDDVKLHAGAAPDAAYVRSLEDRGVQQVYLQAYASTLEAAKAKLEDIAENVIAKLR